MKQHLQALRDKWVKFRWGGLSLFSLAVAVFLAGHFTMDSYISTCRAQIPRPPPTTTSTPVIGGFCYLATPNPACTGFPCEGDTTSEDSVDAIWPRFHDTLVELASSSPDYTATERGGGTHVSGTGLEGFADGIVDAMLFSLMDRLNDIELGYIDWFETMFFYNLKPAMMDMTDQVNSGTADQTRTFQASQDAEDSDRVNVGHMTQQTSDAAKLRLSENGACVGTGSSGGSQRQYNLAREAKKSFQKETTFNDALNRRGGAGAKGRAAKAATRSALYEGLFCSATANDGDAACTATPVPGAANADILPSKTIYGSLTIPMHDNTPVGGTPPPGITNRGDVYEAATKELVNNMTGDPTLEPIPPEALRGAQGIEAFIERRPYAARMAAVRSVPQLGITWRTPGTRLSQMVQELRNEGGTPGTACATTTAAGNEGEACEISNNPSYKEVMHAISVDRFTTGRYANDMTTSESDIEMEKLTIESFYLMQLRDYYELMERMALTLSVQVAVMAEQVPVNVPQMQRPR